MSKLVDYKQWLSIEKAAIYLTENVFFQLTDEADVLQFALDELLTVSVNITQPLNVIVWKGEHDEQAFPPEPTIIIGPYDLLLDFGSGADELLYRLKVLQNGYAEKLDKPICYLLGDNGLVYELPVDHNLELVIRTSVIKEFEYSILEKTKPDEPVSSKAPLELQLDRKLAVIQKQGVMPEVPNNQKLIDTPLSDLISENGLLACDGFDRAFNVYIWLSNLKEELNSINHDNYNDKKDYDGRVKVLNKKISEISNYLNSLDNSGNEIKSSNCNSKKITHTNELSEITNHFISLQDYCGLTKLKDRWSELLNKTIYTEDIFKFALDDDLDIYWYSHEAIRVLLSFDVEIAKKINGTDTWESLLHQFIALPNDVIQVLMSGRDATLTCIDTDKNKVLGTPKELENAATDCLVLDQNIKVLQTDKLFIKEIDALEFEKVLLQTKKSLAPESLNSLNAETKQIKGATVDALFTNPPKNHSEPFENLKEQAGNFIDESHRLPSKKELWKYMASKLEYDKGKRAIRYPGNEKWTDFDAFDSMYRNRTKNR